LWRDYKADRAPDAREGLILHYARLVKFAADRVAAGVPQHVDRADLVSYGLFGLIDAIDKFDLGRGIKFETYAISRIKGAILDELRSIDWVPRSVRAHARAIDRVHGLLEGELRRSPSRAEVAAELGVLPSQLDQARSRVAAASVLALDEPIGLDGGDGGTATLGDTIADPVDAFESWEISDSVSRAIGTLPDRDRLVLTLYYYEQLTLADIGAVLGVTESRVCQMHTSAIVKLRRAIARADGDHPALSIRPRVSNAPSTAA
jgi:RNA polymerase sigma factor FliA